MKTCEQRNELQAQLKTAFEHLYSFKDVPGKTHEAKNAEKKVHQIRRALGDYVAKHGCNKDT
jgi:hypothetical protein